MNGQHFNRAGFTLIEVLVTLVLIGLLVAFVFPVVSQQVNQADAPRVAQDLAGIRTGIEVFQLNVRPSFPGDLEDLTQQIQAGSSSLDADVTGGAYTSGQANRWSGPYIDAAISQSTDNVTTGFDATIAANIEIYDDDLNTTTTSPGTNTFVALVITGLSATQFVDVNDLIDGETETVTDTAGKLQFNGTSAFFLAAPIRN